MVLDCIAAVNKHSVPRSRVVSFSLRCILLRTDTKAFSSPAKVFSTTKLRCPFGSVTVYRSVAVKDFSGAFFLVTPSMAKNKKQHVIPNCYLKAWCDPAMPAGQTPYIWRISREGPLI